MYIHKIAIKNFRLLQDVELLLEKQTTVIVGRNNSGKTSLTELFRRLLTDQSPKFCLEDFSLGIHEQFWNAYKLYQEGNRKDFEIKDALPFIEVRLVIDYQDDHSELGVLGDGFIIELDDKCATAIVVIRYQIKDGKISSLFGDIALPSLNAGTPLPKSEPTQLQPENQEVPPTISEPESVQRVAFFKVMKERIQKAYYTSLITIDPNDSTNERGVEWSKLNKLILSGFINAQRGLDDITHTDRNTLGKILEALFNNALLESAQPDDQTVAQEIQRAIQSLQRDINENFSKQLTNLVPSIRLFGYPGLKDPGLQTETTLDATRLLRDHTKIHYSGINGINLPESYNGLGARNLIFILLNLLEFFKTYRAAIPSPGIHLIFIEEPEAHLHPQMQAVFIRQLNEIAAVFAKNYNQDKLWPVQFIVSTHSSHLANEAPFEATRYFLTTSGATNPNLFTTKIKDLKYGLSNTPQQDREFLHQYMTLTRCDLLFADKAVLIEGTSERLLLPMMIRKIDQTLPDEDKLSSQYISVVEVGGAYAHIFFKLLDFLELRTLIITDLDSIDHTDSRKSCKVSVGTRTSNACIKKWFDNSNLTPKCLIEKCDNEKTNNLQRIAFQIPEIDDGPCGRSLEDAFILANPAMFALTTEGSVDERETDAWNKAISVKKSDFALKHAIEETGWNVPRYIADGLRWLACDKSITSLTPDTNGIPTGS